MLRACLGALVLVLLAAFPVSAQTLSADANKPYIVEATHDGVSTSWYSLQVDGAQLGGIQDRSALSNGVIAFPDVSFQRGQHALVICAHNDDGSACSDPVTVDAKLPPPSKPGAPTITIQTTTALRIQPDGTVQMVAHEAKVIETPEPQE